MLCVYMENEQEAKLFCKKLQYHEMVWILQEKRGFYIQIYHNVFQNIELLIYFLLLEVWATCTKKDKISDIIRYTYYYEDEIEIEQIRENAMALLLGDELNNFDIQNDLQDTIIEWLRMHTNGDTIDYETYVDSTDLLAESLLSELIGMAIDDMKQEEHYQNFVHTIRGYIANSTSKYKAIHVIQGENFTFYQDDGHMFSEQELKEEIQINPVYIVGLDENELNLTPLLAMVPDFIYIYGDSPPDAKTISIMNIFEERATFKPLNQFPFALV
ncbi:hypothetical protein GCM10011351_10710 [Paraliobacillus quinghaiensis]|uniref:Sporulation protein YtxC n=1 Tax=Paraliobacillus quinghaiensis TaxID=470815 RepID=A0A917TLT7_9BACI|nr:sporulation protein YtxC [Paraliobacillus quinghaiensis]GGM26791.1 hypothetical protein GCM10011351_10710 [Paraliobacillus quinghaiensis]